VLLNLRQVVDLAEQLLCREIGPRSRHVVALEVRFEDRLQVTLKTFEGGGNAAALASKCLSNFFKLV